MLIKIIGFYQKIANGSIVQMKKKQGRGLYLKKYLKEKEGLLRSCRVELVMMLTIVTASITQTIQIK